MESGNHYRFLNWVRVNQEKMQCRIGVWRTYFYRFMMTSKSLSGRKVFLVGAIGLMSLSIVAAASNVLIWIATSKKISSHIESVPSMDVAIVLGAKVYEDGSPSAILTDRLFAAYKLYRLGKVQKIIVSGDHMSPEYDEPRAMYQYLVSRGVPSAAVYMDHAGFRTLDTMVRAKQVFGVKTAIICTQGFHLGRAVFLAQQQGIKAWGVETNFRKYRRQYINWLREFVARCFAVLDVYIFHTRPRYLGPKVDLSAPGWRTFD